MFLFFFWDNLTNPFSPLLCFSNSLITVKGWLAATHTRGRCEAKTKNIQKPKKQNEPFSQPWRQKLVSAHFRYGKYTTKWISNWINRQFPANRINHTTKSPLYGGKNKKKQKKNPAHTRCGSIAMGPHGGAAKTAHRRREIDCPPGVASESSFLLCRPPRRNSSCLQMQANATRPETESEKKSSLDRAASDSSSSQSLHQIKKRAVRHSFWPRSVAVEWVGTGYFKTLGRRTDCIEDGTQRESCVITHVSLQKNERGEKKNQSDEDHAETLRAPGEVWLALCWLVTL